MTEAIYVIPVSGRSVRIPAHDAVAEHPGELVPPEGCFVQAAPCWETWKRLGRCYVDVTRTYKPVDDEAEDDGGDTPAEETLDLGAVDGEEAKPTAPTSDGDAASATPPPAPPAPEPVEAPAPAAKPRKKAASGRKKASPAAKKGATRKRSKT